MIAISTISGDQATSDVIEWLKNEIVLRVNCDSPLESFIRPESWLNSDRVLPSAHALWYRKWGMVSFEDNTLEGGVLHHAKRELDVLNTFMLRRSEKSIILGSFEPYTENKLNMLVAFDETGLKIPPTIVTSKKSDLLDFKSKYNEIIVKALSDGIRFNADGRYFKTYTEILTDDLIELLPDTFFPSIFQLSIKKQFEIRSFFLDNEVYSGAIYSTAKIKEVDHRVQMQSKNLRLIPYRLSDEVETKMRSLMKHLHLNTCSFDIIKDLDGELYFLELNPCGQFGNLSYECNYYLEKRVASFLMNYEKNNISTR